VGRSIYLGHSTSASAGVACTFYIIKMGKRASYCQQMALGDTQRKTLMNFGLLINMSLHSHPDRRKKKAVSKRAETDR
jgi:hypothetical protein